MDCQREVFNTFRSKAFLWSGVKPQFSTRTIELSTPVNSQPFSLIYNMLILGSGETVQSIHVHDKVIVSMTGNNRIAWHSLTDKEVNTLSFDNH